MRTLLLAFHDFQVKRGTIKKMHETTPSTTRIEFNSSLLYLSNFERVCLTSSSVPVVSGLEAVFALVAAFDFGFHIDPF